jgi:hypothetical protein
MKVLLLIFFAATTAMAMPTADPSSQRKGKSFFHYQIVFQKYSAKLVNPT